MTITESPYTFSEWYKIKREDILSLYYLVSNNIKNEGFKWGYTEQIIYKRFVDFLFQLSDTNKENVCIDSYISKTYVPIKSNKENSYFLQNIFNLNVEDISEYIYYEMKSYCDYRVNRLFIYSNSQESLNHFLFINISD